MNSLIGFPASAGVCEAQQNFMSQRKKDENFSPEVSCITSSSWLARPNLNYPLPNFGSSFPVK